MAFKVGDKVKYDSGDWWFYGTISAVIENSISPCYRLTVDRMVKANCKYSITQFEFELSLDNDDENDKAKQKRKHSEMDYLKQIHDASNQDIVSKVAEQEPKNLPRRTKSGAWERNLASFQKGERNNSIYTWMNRNRRLFKSDKLPKEKLDILKSINFPFESTKKKDRVVKHEKVEKPQKLIKSKPKRTNTNAWERNLELYKKGEKSNTVYAWISGNRKKYHANKLSEEQLKKLIEANFPLDVPPREKQLTNWDKQFRLWQNGNRNPSLQIWRETSVKRFVDGKLSQERIDKLKEVGILK